LEVDEIMKYILEYVKEEETNKQENKKVGCDVNWVELVGRPKKSLSHRGS
jgi:chromatin remodeling complex protein RSC6